MADLSVTAHAIATMMLPVPTNSSIARSLRSNEREKEIEAIRRRTIVGGHGVHGHEYKWMSSLRYELPGRVFQSSNAPAFQRFCGGALIRTNPIAVLTAAHCLDSFKNGETAILQSSGDAIEFFIDLGRTLGPHAENLPGSSYTVGGVSGTDNPTDYKEISVSSCDQIYIHEDWNGKAGNGKDIALIIVREQSEINKLSGYSAEDVATIPQQLSSDNACCDDNEQLTAIGYGLDDDNKDPTDTLERITLEYHPVKECAEMLEDYYGKPSNNPASDKTILCASGDTQSHREVDTCQGDSGGPLFRIDDDDRAEVVGVVSYGINGYYPNDGCNADHPDDLTLPAFYTSVGHYNGWIEQKIALAVDQGSCTVAGHNQVFDHMAAAGGGTIGFGVIASILIYLYTHCYQRRH